MPDNTKKKVFILTITLALLALLGVGIALSVNSKGDSQDSNGLSVNSAGSPTGDKSKQRTAVSTKAENLIHSSRELASRPNIDETLKEISEGNFDNVPKDFSSQFYLTDSGKDSDALQKAAYIALIQLGKALNQGIPLDRKLTPISADATEYIYLDLETGNAFVPLSIYLGEEAAFSLQFVWVDGEWMFAPYSLVDTVSSADIIAGNSDKK